GEPAAAELPVRADIETLRVLLTVGLLALAPEVLAAHDEGAVRPALERLPAIDEGRVLKARGVGHTRTVVAVGVGERRLDVVIVTEVAEHAVLAVVGQVALCRSDEQAVARRAVEDL